MLLCVSLACVSREHHVEAEMLVILTCPGAYYQGTEREALSPVDQNEAILGRLELSG